MQGRGRVDELQNRLAADWGKLKISADFILQGNEIPGTAKMAKSTGGSSREPRFSS